MRVSVQRAEGLPAAAVAALRTARLALLLRDAGDRLGVPQRDSLRVRLTGDAELRELNERWLGEDSVTDVLAFPADEPGHVGDVAISVEQALRQSSDGPAELRLLAVHGLLHCLGHDHADAAGAEEMTRLTRELLPGQEVPEL